MGISSLTKRPRRNHIPGDSSSRLLTSEMSASAASSCFFSSANSSVRLATERATTCMGKATVNNRDYDPRHAVVFDSIPSLGGYYLYRAHFMCKTVKRYVIFCVPQTPSANFRRPHTTRFRRMRSSQSPYSLMCGDLLR